MKGAPAAELLLMALTLKSRANLLLVESENVLENLTHESVKKLLLKSIDVYRQNPERFDRLISQLMTSVDEPRFLFHDDPLLRESVKDQSAVENEGDLNSQDWDEKKNEGRLVFDEEMEQKLLKDTLKRIRENFLRDQLKKLALDLKVNPTPEKMQLMMSLQKNLSSLYAKKSEREV